VSHVSQGPLYRAPETRQTVAGAEAGDGPPQASAEFGEACAALLADLASVPWLQKRLERYAAEPARWAEDEQKAATWIAAQAGEPLRWPEAAPLLREYVKREGR
jgi:hypothetical protein